MELKNYQKTVLDELRTYLDALDRENDPQRAFVKYWQERWVITPEIYFEKVPGCPYVSLKVPTAWGKTYLAANALWSIFERYPKGAPRVVLWLVPWDNILTQTIRNLSDKDHPYRRRLDEMFSGRVEIYDKTAVLSGTRFDPSTVKEQVCIIVLSFASFRARTKDGRKAYQENGNLAAFAPTYENREGMINWVDDTALVQVFNRLRPVCVVDESHRAESELSIETLIDFNPSFILGLTATPQKDANIVSYVGAAELKKEEMVKLPVVAYNLPSREEVISRAKLLRDSLEERAIKLEAESGEYIRPIVLFQAEPRTKTDTVNYSKIKENLVRAGIPEEQIAIKVSDKDELRGKDLMSRDCPVRYVITVNALKEGWDCPFAYILASLANRSSETDVTQILGRVLRQPYARRTKEPILNLSYVFSSSEKFSTTIDNIVRALGVSGFGKEDCYSVDEGKTPEPSQEEKVAAAFGHAPIPQSSIHVDDGADSFELAAGSLAASASSGIPESIEQILVEAEKQEITFSSVAATAKVFEVPLELTSRASGSTMDGRFKSVAQWVAIPTFWLKEDAGLFGSERILSETDLLQWFDLGSADANISLDSTSDTLYTVDVEESGDIRYARVAPAIQEYLLKYMDALSPEEQVKYVAGVVRSQMGRFDGFDQKAVDRYVQRVLSNANSTELENVKKSPYLAATLIERKAKEAAESHKERKFYEWLDSDRIVAKPTWTFPEIINPVPVGPAISGSLYSKEAESNGLERSVADRFSGMPNVLFWHRNLERRGFAINGWMKHYPDFIVQTESWKILLIETKGADRDNKDSKRKLKLGQKWAEKSWSEFKYFMVFSGGDPLEGAYSIESFFSILKDL